MGDGRQVPTWAVSFAPTRAVPEIVGVGDAENLVSTVEWAEVTDFVEMPGRLPVTVTVSLRPSYDAGIRNVELVAPEMFVPSIFHW